MSVITVSLMTAAVLLGLGCRWTWRERGSLRRRLGAGSLLGLGSLALICGTYSLWYHHRAVPSEVRLELFQGIRYHREPRRSPRPLVLHWVEIDLDAPGVSFLVTPPSPTGGRQLRARTVSQFLARYRTQLAINGGYFTPWFSRGPLWYYPHIGDPVDPFGFAAYRGRIYHPLRRGQPLLLIDRAGRVSIALTRLVDPPRDVYLALGGAQLLLQDGELTRAMQHCSYRRRQPQPRTAAALDRGSHHLLLVVVDGRQPGYSEGLGLSELARIIRRQGGYQAINLDGGGSSTLVIQGRDGRPRVLNSPIHGRVPPGLERPVATHLGVYARELP